MLPLPIQVFFKPTVSHDQICSYTDDTSHVEKSTMVFVEPSGKDLTWGILRTLVMMSEHFLRNPSKVEHIHKVVLLKYLELKIITSNGMYLYVQHVWTQIWVRGITTNLVSNHWIIKQCGYIHEDTNIEIDLIQETYSQGLFSTFMYIFRLVCCSTLIKILPK